MEPDAPVACCRCKIRQATCIPVIIIPLRNWPLPTYMQGTRLPMCNQCRLSFTMKDFDIYPGSWYDAACDRLRSYKKPASNPFPNDPTFKWEDRMLNPDWDPAPKDECHVVFWAIKTLKATGMSDYPYPIRKVISQ